ncbi:MAG: hypothetical protein AAFQ99_11555 [Pseudomonadota bacterium]
MMLKFVKSATAGAAVLALLGVVATSAAANEKQSCLKSTFEVAQTAQTKSPNEGQLQKLEALLTEIETACEAGKFGEADTKRKALASLVASM